MTKILVTYATFTGSTAGVAEAIAKTLADKGAEVDLLPMRDVKDVSGYDAVVAGSAIQNSAWLPEASAFVQQHQAQLATKKFAPFMVCLALAMKNKKLVETNRKNIVTWLNTVRNLVPTVDEGYFAGILDIKKIPYLAARIGFQISVWTGVWAEGDHRDWDAIRAWASNLYPKLTKPV